MLQNEQTNWYFLRFLESTTIQMFIFILILMYFLFHLFCVFCAFVIFLGNLCLLRVIFVVFLMRHHLFVFEFFFEFYLIIIDGPYFLVLIVDNFFCKCLQHGKFIINLASLLICLPTIIFV